MFRPTKETTRKRPENNRRRQCEREHEEQDQAVKEKCLGKMNQEPTEIGDEHPLHRSDFISVGAGTTYTRITG